MSLGWMLTIALIVFVAGAWIMTSGAETEEEPIECLISKAAEEKHEAMVEEARQKAVEEDTEAKEYQQTDFDHTVETFIQAMISNIEFVEESSDSSSYYSYGGLQYKYCDTILQTPRTFFFHNSTYYPMRKYWQELSVIFEEDNDFTAYVRKELFKELKDALLDEDERQYLEEENKVAKKLLKISKGGCNN